MKPKRILYMIWSLDQGGAEQVVMNLAKGIDRKRFEPVICCLNEKGRYAASLEAFGIRVHALHKKGRIDPGFLIRLIQLIKREKADLIHTHLFTANLWGRIAAQFTGVPLVLTEHNMDTWKGNFQFTLDRMLTGATKRLIFVCRKVEDFYREKLPPLNGKAKVIYNGIDTKHFSIRSPSAALRARLGIKSSDKVIGVVGRLVPQKAHADFIEAIRILRERRQDIVGLIVGEGELRLELVKKVRDLQLEKGIIFTGFSTEMAGLYHAMEIFALPSLREGFPMTILEAMAAGIPVVATDVGGVKECMQNGENGLLVPAGNPAALADALTKVLENEKLRRKIIQAAEDKVEKYFSIQKMVADHEALYSEVLGS